MDTQIDMPAIQRIGFVQRELDRIAVALLAEPSQECYAPVVAAQQALSWALEPVGFKSPYDSIMGIPEAPADCSGDPRLPESSDTCSPTG